MRKRLIVMMVIVGALLPAFASQALAQGPQEGIKVHGHWVIDVRNPDGTLSSHLDFENALYPSGAQALAMILGKTTDGVRGWLVVLQRDNGSPFGSSSPGGPNHVGNGIVAEPAVLLALVDSPSLFPNLVVAQVGATVVMKGSATALGIGDVAGVRTQVSIGGSGGSPRIEEFSGTVLPAAIHLIAGQIVQVTVTLSFS